MAEIRRDCQILSCPRIEKMIQRTKPSKVQKKRYRRTQWAASLLASATGVGSFSRSNSRAIEIGVSSTRSKTIVRIIIQEMAGASLISALSAFLYDRWAG